MFGRWRLTMLGAGYKSWFRRLSCDYLSFVPEANTRAGNNIRSGINRPWGGRSRSWRAISRSAVVEDPRFSWTHQTTNNLLHPPPTISVSVGRLYGLWQPVAVQAPPPLNTGFSVHCLFVCFKWQLFSSFHGPMNCLKNRMRASRHSCL